MSTTLTATDRGSRPLDPNVNLLYQVDYYVYMRSLDDDGAENDLDVCAFTPLSEVVDSATGCSIVQLCPCEGPRGTTEAWRNHGQYVSCVAKSADSFSKKGLITAAQKDAIVSAAARSSCGQ